MYHNRAYARGGRGCVSELSLVLPFAVALVSELTGDTLELKVSLTEICGADLDLVVLVIPNIIVVENIGAALVLTTVEFPSFLLGGKCSATFDKIGSTLYYDFKRFMGSL